MSSTPGGLNVFATQKKLFDDATTYFNGIGWDIVDGEVPDSETVKMTSGVVKPYLVMRFSDILAASAQASFGGPTYDGYYSLFQVICVGDTGMHALELASLTNQYFIGKIPDVNSSPVTKDYGGGSLTIRGVNSKPTFMVSIAAFRFLTNMSIN